MITIKPTKHTHRFLARLVIEAKTPLAVGSGEKDIISDALVATDVNGLPYIPGTAIAGVFRSIIDEAMPEKNECGQSITDILFGFQETKTQKTLRKEYDKQNNPNKVSDKDASRGSQIIFTEAKILNSKREVVDGLNIEALKTDPLLKNYAELPIREHVRISAKGATVGGGKFDEQVVFAGTRFCFEMEMVSDGTNENTFEQVLEQFQSQTFRIGSGTRCGFGEIEVREIHTAELNLKNDLQSYLNKSSNLQESSKWPGWKTKKMRSFENNQWIKYELTLQPEDFFLFGSGFDDDEADITPVKGKKVVWENGFGTLKDNFVLIPATSVKGALAHRVAYYYNKQKGVFADKLPLDDYKQHVEKHVGKNNDAVRILFGSEGEKIGNEMKNQLRGNLIFSDIIEKPLQAIDKILNHVSIDRFTGGAIDGALFSEKVTYGKGEVFTTEILFNEKAVKCLVEKEKSAKDNVEKEKLNFEKVQKAFECALEDICKGMLPLGGGVNRGNGVFKGSVTKNGEPLQ